ncbi:MAG: hypothetical protein BWK80_07850 [Desulfobacteraceae bacterium IS3]|nr:MAG: hypothetical protein BWK80_07850 [Desulfobacteraceae bacterium IS3]
MKRMLYDFSNRFHSRYHAPVITKRMLYDFSNRFHSRYHAPVITKRMLRRTIFQIVFILVIMPLSGKGAERIKNSFYIPACKISNRFLITKRMLRRTIFQIVFILVIMPMSGNGAENELKILPLPHSFLILP